MRCFALIFIFLILNIENNYAQSFKLIFRNSPKNQDSSLYDVCKISANEFWTAGENGVLLSIDTLGQAKRITYPSNGAHILKILNNGKNVYLFADKGTIYIYTTLDNSWSVKNFPDFENKCFYDATFLPNEQVAVCGGASGIAKAKKVIPRGFIMVLDLKLLQIKKEWKYWRKFVWHMNTNTDGELMASLYNGFNSKIEQMQNHKWVKTYKVTGLVHHFFMKQDSIIYSGLDKVKKRTIGIVGKINSQYNWQVIDTNNTVWSVKEFRDGLLYLSNNKVLYNKNNELIVLNATNSLPWYEVATISSNKFIVVGSSGQYAIVQLQP